MIQFYFLSILLNFLGGAVLAGSLIEKRLSFFTGIEDFYNERANVKLTIGILSLLVGILKFLSVVEGDVKVVGDLLPALSGIMVGFALLAAYYRARTDVQTDIESESGFNAFLQKYEIIIGICAIVIAVIHFFIPRVLFL